MEGLHCRGEDIVCHPLYHLTLGQTDLRIFKSMAAAGTCNMNCICRLVEETEIFGV